MSIRVVTQAGLGIGDEHAWVPDKDDLEELSKKIDGVKKLCGTSVSKKVFEARMADVEREVADVKKKTIDAVKAVSATVVSGEWRAGFKRDVGQALEQLDKRYAAINDELNKKIEELSKVSELEAALSQKIIEFQENIRNVIEGRHVVPPPVPRKEKRCSRLIQFVLRMIPHKMNVLFS